MTADTPTPARDVAPHYCSRCDRCIDARDVVKAHNIECARSGERSYAMGYIRFGS